MLRMDEFNKIRKDFKVKQLSIYQIAQQKNRSWATIKKVVSMTEDEIRNRGKRPNRKKKVITKEVKQAIKELLEHEIAQKIHKKHRLTAHVIFKKLTQNGVYSGSEKSLRREVKKQRALLKQSKEKVYLELDFTTDKQHSYLQVDHGPIEVIIDGHTVPAYLFVATVPGKILRYCQVYLTKAQEAWGDFHERSFKFFGGSFNYVIYDNDSVLKSKNAETLFAIELQSHYGFKAIYCNKASGWEKGSVEGSVGHCRRNYLPGRMEFKSTKELNSYLNSRVLEDISNNTHYKTGEKISDLFNQLSSQLTQLPLPKNWGIWVDARVNKFQYVRYKYKNYSVPIRYVGAKLRLFVTAEDIYIYDDGQRIRSYPRLFFGDVTTRFELEDFLPQLERKPHAINHAKVLFSCAFAKEIQEIKRRIFNRYSQKEATEHFLNTLKLCQTATMQQFGRALQECIALDITNYSSIKSTLNNIQYGQQQSKSDELYQLNIEPQYNLDNYIQLMQ